MVLLVLISTATKSDVMSHMCCMGSELNCVERLLCLKLFCKLLKPEQKKISGAKRSR